MGLDALLGPQGADLPGRDGDTASTLPLEMLRPGQYQPRTRMDEGALYELAQSIREQGIMQPILVRPLRGGDAGLYEIIAGERRYRAANIAGLDAVPVLVREVGDEAAAAMALIENIQREDLNPLEEAQGLARLVREFGYSHEQAAAAVGRSRSATSNLLRLLNLAEPVQSMLMAGDLDMGHARALLAMEGVQQITAAHQIAARKMTVREAESLVRRLNSEATAQEEESGRSAQGGTAPTETPLQREAQRVAGELSDLLMAQVHIRLKKSLRRRRTVGNVADAPEDVNGEIAIEFASMQALNDLIERLRRQ